MSAEVRPSLSAVKNASKDSEDADKDTDKDSDKDSDKESDKDSDKNNSGKIPTTGDDSNIGMVMILMFVGMFGFAVTVRRRKSDETI
jgi:LPXTG-motif cell wall-anchored protein